MSELTYPLAVLAELTHRCPLQCPYCYNPVNLERTSAELDTEAWLAVIREAAELGILQIHFSGGEPTARKDLPILVRAARDAGLYTNLITSGVLLDEAGFANLVSAGIDHVQLSFQDSDAAGCDRIGGYAGGYEKKVRFAGWVTGAGLPLTANMVVHRQNIRHLETLIELAVELGAQRVEIAHVQYYGWAYKNRAALMPSRADLQRAVEIVEAARERLKGVLTFDHVVPDYYARRPKACMGGWGRRFLNITPSGHVLPCHAAESIAGMVFDKVGDKPLREIWESSEAFTRFRGTDWMPEPCRSCDQRAIDWGGCRCQAFALTGDAAKTDPVCGKSPDHERILQLAERDSAAEAPPFLYRSYGNVEEARKLVETEA
jgi:pyrroloquinoline quinone biosynthesis protein E